LLIEGLLIGPHFHRVARHLWLHVHSTSHSSYVWQMLSKPASYSSPQPSLSPTNDWRKACTFLRRPTEQWRAWWLFVENARMGEAPNFKEWSGWSPQGNENLWNRFELDSQYFISHQTVYQFEPEYNMKGRS